MCRVIYLAQITVFTSIEWFETDAISYINGISSQINFTPQSL